MKVAQVPVTDRKLSELNDSDWLKLEAFEAAWKRDGDIAFERLRESDFIAYVRIVAGLNPKAMREAFEEELLNLGMTNREFMEKCLKNARRKH